MNQNDLAKNQHDIVELVEQFNINNDELSRYSIFNTYKLTTKIDGVTMFIDIHFFDNNSDNTETSFGVEQTFKINLSDNKDTLWYKKLISKYNNSTLNKIQTAKQFTKPQIGILIYDEFTGNYYLNPRTGPLLLQNKHIQRKLSLTKIELLYLYKKIKKAIDSIDTHLFQYVGIDSIPIKDLEEIYNQNLEITKFLENVESVPRIEIIYENDDKFLNLKLIATNKFESIFEKDFVEINTYESKFKIGDEQEMEKAYNKFKFALNLNGVLKEIANVLIDKNEPEIFELKKDKYYCTEDGRKLLNELDLIELLNGTF